jgi:hypothetical protein
MPPRRPQVRRAKLHHVEAFDRQDCIEVFDAFPLFDHHGDYDLFERCHDSHFQIGRRLLVMSASSTRGCSPILSAVSHFCVGWDVRILHEWWRINGEGMRALLGTAHDGASTGVPTSANCWNILADLMNGLGETAWPKRSFLSRSSSRAVEAGTTAEFDTRLTPSDAPIADGSGCRAR